MSNDSLTDLRFEPILRRGRVEDAHAALSRFLEGGDEQDILRAQSDLSAGFEPPEAVSEDYKEFFEEFPDVAEFRFHVEVQDGDSRGITFPEVVLKSGGTLERHEMPEEMDHAIGDLDDYLLNNGVLYDLFETHGRWTPLRVRREQVLPKEEEAR